MKIRITDKNDEKDQMIIDLSKLSAVRINGNGELALYSNLASPAWCFSKDDYKFEYAEVSNYGTHLEYIEKTLNWILLAYSSEI